MKLTKKLLPIASAAALVTAGMVTPIAAQAETSASMAFSNMYLWRGQNLSPDGSVISGSLDYGHESGMYAGVWTTSETGGHETDLYIGFGGEAGGFSYDISYWWYLYPEDTDDSATVDTTVSSPAQPVDFSSGFLDIGDSDVSEFVLSGGYGPVTATIYIGADSDIEDYYYYTIGVDFAEKFNLTYGAWSFDETEGADYSHVTLTYAPIDELSFAVSMAQEDDPDTLEEDPLFQIMYTKDFDLSK